MGRIILFVNIPYERRLGSVLIPPRLTANGGYSALMAVKSSKGMAMKRFNARRGKGVRHRREKHGAILPELPVDYPDPLRPPIAG